MAGNGEEKLIRSELLSYIQCHLNRTVKNKMIEGAGCAFSEDAIIDSKIYLKESLVIKSSKLSLKEGVIARIKWKGSNP